MKDDAAIFKWTAVFVGVIIVCFGLGYFVLGPRAQTSSGSGGLIIEETKPGAVAVVNRPAASPEPNMSVVERTDEIEAKQKKKEAEARKKKEEEAKKEEEEKKKAEEAAKATPTPSPSPSPASDSDVPPSPEGTAVTTPEPVATPTPAPTPTPEAPRVSTELYRVRVGAFANRDNAQSLAAELNGRGYSTTIVRDEGGSATMYRLQVGAYRDKKTADNTLKELKANGYDAVVSRS